MKRILAIDDDEDILKLLKVHLKNRFELITASSGEEGFRKLRSGDPLPDLILLDLQMPVMSGREFAKALNEDPTLKNIPIIYLTANVHYSDDVEHRFEFDFLNKPIEKDDLLVILDSFFKLS